MNLVEGLGFVLISLALAAMALGRACGVGLARLRGGGPTPALPSIPIDVYAARHYGRLPKHAAKQYALEMLGEHYAHEDALQIGGVAVAMTRVREIPAAHTADGLPVSLDLRILYVVYPEGADEYYEYDGRGRLIYCQEARE